MDAFLAKIAPVIDLRGTKPTGIRAGLIPCGGVVHPVAVSRALLVGDAAGMVSPVTAGGIHTALKHGLAAGHAVADFLHGRAEDPSGWFVRSYPKFRVKRLLRVLFDHFQWISPSIGRLQRGRCGPRPASSTFTTGACSNRLSAAGAHWPCHWNGIGPGSAEMM